MMIFALALTGCNGDNDEVTTNGDDPVVEGAVSGGMFRMHINNPAFIDPYNAFESEGIHVVRALFDPLVNPNILDPIQLEPGAALSWDINDEATVFTFNLDPDGMFADGNPVVADDFIFAFNRIADPNAVNTMTGDEDAGILHSQLSHVVGYDAFRDGDADGMEGLVALDDHTLEITLSSPFGDFIYNLSHPSFVPVQAAHIENGVEFDGDTVSFGVMPIGNGPFRMTEPWRDGQFINTERNPYFAGAPAYVDGVEFRIFTEADAAFMAWQAGDLDYVDISPGHLQSTKATYGTASNGGFTANPGEQVIYGPQSGTYYMVLNVEDDVTGDPEFRRAVSLAINREAINTVVWEDGYVIATDILPPDIPGYQTGAWADARFDREAAIEALEASDWDGEPVGLIYNTGSVHESIIELIAADLLEIGVETVVEGMEWATYNITIHDGDYQIGRRGWMSSYPSTHYWLFELFDSEAGNNDTFFSNPEVDAGLANAATIADADERAAEYARVNQLIQADNPVIPIAYYAFRQVTSDRMHNVTVSPLNVVDFRNLWIAADAQ